MRVRVCVCVLCGWQVFVCVRVFARAPLNLTADLHNMFVFHVWCFSFTSSCSRQDCFCGATTNRRSSGTVAFGSQIFSPPPNRPNRIVV